MQDFGHVFSLALGLIATADAELTEIILLSLKVSLSAAGVLGLGLGATLAILRFPGRGAADVLLMHSKPDEEAFVAAGWNAST